MELKRPEHLTARLEIRVVEEKPRSSPGRAVCLALLDARGQKHGLLMKLEIPPLPFRGHADVPGLSNGHTLRCSW